MTYWFSSASVMSLKSSIRLYMFIFHHNQYQNTVVHALGHEASISSAWFVSYIVTSVKNMLPFKVNLF
jgi:hypothetical protein